MCRWIAKIQMRDVRASLSRGHVRKGKWTSTGVYATVMTVMQLAVQLGASLERKDGKGATPLFSACEQGRIKIVRALIAAGAVLTTCNRDEEAPLYIAALRGHAEVVQVMLGAFEARQLDWMVSHIASCWSIHGPDAAQKLQNLA